MRFNEILQSDGVMGQRVRVSDIPDRREWLGAKCADKSVLHVGCCDVPVFDPNNNLHIELSRVTSRLDGLDLSVPGIEILKSHVLGDYFTTTGAITQEYDLVLAPEVIEHTPDPGAFLAGIFAIRARAYLITAPHFQWFDETSRQGDIFVEQVHSDHRAWYSPYTLLNTVRPFIDEGQDRIEVSLIKPTGSVAVEITKNRTITPWERTIPGVDDLQILPDQVLVIVDRLRQTGDSAAALHLLSVYRKHRDAPELYTLQAEILDSLGRHMDLYRLAIAFLAQHPQDKPCILHAAMAADKLGQTAEAEQLRRMADKID